MFQCPNGIKRRCLCIIWGHIRLSDLMVYFVNLERDKSNAYCQNLFAIYMYRLFFTKFPNVLLLWLFYLFCKNIQPSRKILLSKKIYFIIYNEYLLRFYFPIWKKNLNSCISAKLGSICKWNFQKCPCIAVLTYNR